MEKCEDTEEDGVGCYPWKTRLRGKEGTVIAPQQEANCAIPYAHFSPLYSILGYYHSEYGENTIDRKVTHVSLLRGTVIF